MNGAKNQPEFRQLGLLHLVDDRGTGFPSMLTHQQYPVPWWHWISTYWPFSLHTGTNIGIPDSLLVFSACSRSSKHRNSSKFQKKIFIIQDIRMKEMNMITISMDIKNYMKRNLRCEHSPRYCNRTWFPLHIVWWRWHLDGYVILSKPQTGLFFSLLQSIWQRWLALALSLFFLRTPKLLLLLLLLLLYLSFLLWWFLGSCIRENDEDLNIFLLFELWNLRNDVLSKTVLFNSMFISFIFRRI